MYRNSKMKIEIAFMLAMVVFVYGEMLCGYIFYVVAS